MMSSSAMLPQVSCSAWQWTRNCRSVLEYSATAPGPTAIFSKTLTHGNAVADATMVAAARARMDLPLFSLPAS
eukprot:6089263-Pyramimonas_sp.AAC.1